MKKILNLYPLDTFFSRGSPSAGATKPYFHAPEHIALLGSAKSIKLQWIGRQTSHTTAEITLKIFHSSYPGRRPHEAGEEITGLSNVTFTALRPPSVTIPSPFMGLLEVVLEVRDSAGSPQEVRVEGELWATLIFEE